MVILSNVQSAVLCPEQGSIHKGILLFDDSLSLVLEHFIGLSLILYKK